MVTPLNSINEANHPKPTERHPMELRGEIKDVILLAAQRVLSSTTGDLSAADEAKLRAAPWRTEFPYTPNAIPSWDS